MIGAKSGDRVLVIGAGDGRLAAGVALATGLNGRTLVIDPEAGAQARVDAAAARAGALVEFTAMPAATLALDDGAFDIVVIPHELSARAPQRHQIVSEAARLLRPGGRVMVVERTERSGFRDLLSRESRPIITADDIRALLTEGGLRATRLLGEVDGIAFVEAIKART